MVSRDLTPDQRLADAIADFYADPLGYVMFMFPWDTNPAIQIVELPKKYRDRFKSEYGPDLWACEFLDDLGTEIKKRGFDGRTAAEPIQFSTRSGHGIGKSALVAWVSKFILDTRPYSKGVLTANTAEQLKTKTWAQVGMWHNLSLTRHWFKYNTGRGAMALVHNMYPEQWRLDAQTSREENSESFAGLHAANSTPFYIFDEASGIPDKIFEVREGGTTDGEPMVFDFGNPTRNTGRFFENCAGKFKHRFIQRKIDSRDVAITNKKRLQQWVDDYGEDSDFVKVRVRGEFPSAGSLQFIPSEAVLLAMENEPVQDRSAPLIIGVDVARFGDDESIIYPRMGYDARSWPIKRFRGIDTVQLTGRIVEMLRYFESMGKRCDALFVDGGGVGGGVVDQLRALGRAPIEVQFGSRPTDTTTYRYKSDEMWGRLRDALPKLSLPRLDSRDGLHLKDQLTQREYGYTLQGNKIHLETKADMKERLGGEYGSPDLADALALTFAQDIVSSSVPLGLAHALKVQHEYDPHEAKD